ncbi:GTPase LSG1-2-like isoform X2 [Asparagus officinalis]|uniref:GTPase LSG1-2-like isoform X2 n=1 Tax=Asparagus officinalis TaxID=4686 RepID=UPI00098E1A6A|nr:GTPase LSG1-2-like isoform X2 [Asparagus officinalis]
MGGSKNKSQGLGRALIRHHNQQVQQSKERSKSLRQQSRVLESITDVTDIDAVLERAEEADRLYSADNPAPNLLINLDSDGGTSADERRRLQREEEALHAGSLRVPRRPPWNARMSLEELDTNERREFLVWRRNLAKLEENENLVLTPFEKNLDIWRQLWRVLERSDLAYAREIDEHKKTLLLVNKADLLPLTVRQKWANYFDAHGILFLFWSAKAASASLEGKSLISLNESPGSEVADTKIYGRDELLARLQAEAEAIASLRKVPNKNETHGSSSSASKHVVVGFVGYPNVGKSSTINALVGGKRTGVTSTPGKTKHFQTLIISDELMLCDCPGLVFPSFSSSRYEMIASGVLPIDRMTEHREAVQVVANRVPRQILENVYHITLPKPKAYESQTRPPSASELLRTYCSSRGHVSSSGLPDETRAARQILKDFIDGKIPHYELPPGTINDELGNESDASDSDEEVLEEPSLDQALDDLESFELSGGVLGKTAARAKKKNVGESYKHHKKPLRKKDRSWRVGNDNGDGMPIVRVFQKPAVNFDAIKASNLN